MAWVLFTSGRGPVECGRAVYGITKRIISEVIALSLSVDVIEEAPGEMPATLDSLLLEITGSGADAFVKEIQGTMLWIGKSPFRPYHKRKNWYIGMRIVEAPKTAAVNPGDIRYETMCATGPGGQHVNKTESAVRAIHIPTGMKAVARDHRSQHRNKDLALKRLLHQLSQIEQQSHEQNRRKRWDRHNDLERGNSVRTYIGEEFSHA
jgi:peptide chain release factor